MHSVQIRLLQNSLLAGYPQTTIKLLQQVVNSAAKLILNSRRAKHAKPLRKQLHWLPLEQRIKYKTSCLCYQIITGTAPQYLADLVQSCVPSRFLRSSSDDRTFRIPTFKENSMVVWLSVLLLYKPGILSLLLSVIALLCPPLKLV